MSYYGAIEDEVTTPVRLKVPRLQGASYIRAIKRMEFGGVRIRITAEAKDWVHHECWFEITGPESEVIEVQDRIARLLRRQGARVIEH